MAQAPHPVAYPFAVAEAVVGRAHAHAWVPCGVAKVTTPPALLALSRQRT